MQCPVCNGAMWDNRTTKKNPKQPDYKCKNPSCAKAVWLKKEDPVTKALNNSPAVSKAKNELLNECVLDNAVKLAIHTCKPEGGLANVTMITEVQTYYENLLKIISNEPEI